MDEPFDECLPRFLTFSCEKRRNYLAEDSHKQVIVDQLALCKDRLGFKVYAWTVMPNHVHLLLHPNPEVATVRQILSALKSRTSRIILQRFRERLKDQAPSRLWLRGGGYDRVIASQDEVTRKAAYIEANPVRKGLAPSAKAYLWSSAGSEMLSRDPWWE